MSVSSTSIAYRNVLLGETISTNDCDSGLIDRASHRSSSPAAHAPAAANTAGASGSRNEPAQTKTISNNNNDIILQKNLSITRLVWHGMECEGTQFAVTGGDTIPALRDMGAIGMGTSVHFHVRHHALGKQYFDSVILCEGTIVTINQNWYRGAGR